MNPEQDETHVIKPEQVGQLGLQVFGHVDIGSLDDFREHRDAVPSNGFRFVAEGIERAAGIGCRLEKGAGELMEWFYGSDLGAHDLEEPSLEIAFVFERRSNSRPVVVKRATVEGHYQLRL